MLKNINKIDLVLIIAALMSLIVSEYFYFTGEKMDGIFIGLWVPSILGFACLFKLIREKP